MLANRRSLSDLRQKVPPPELREERPDVAVPAAELDDAFSFEVGPVEVNHLANPPDAPFGIRAIEVAGAGHLVMLPHVEFDGTCREIGDGSNEWLSLWDLNKWILIKPAAGGAGANRSFGNLTSL